MTHTQKKHISLLLAGVFLALLIGGAVLFYSNLTSLSKSAVERLASRDLSLKIEIDSLDIDPAKESVLIKGLTISNPRGYKRGPAITMGIIDIDSRLVTREYLAFQDIRASGVNIAIEVSDNGTNISDLRDMMNAHISRQSSPASPAGLIKMSADHIVFSGTRIEPASVKDAIANDLSPHILPDIHLRAIGDIRDEAAQGLPLPVAAAQILTHVINVALRAAAQEQYLESLTPEQQQAIGARLSLRAQLMEDTKALVNKAPSDAENLKKKAKAIFKVHE